MSELVQKRERAKPTMIAVGNARVVSTGKWNQDLMLDEVVLLEGRARYIPVSELAKRAYLQNTKRSRTQARKNMAALFHKALERGELLSFERGAREVIQAVKVFDPASEQDRQNVERQLNRMHKRRELTQGQFARALGIFNDRVLEKRA